MTFEDGLALWQLLNQIFSTLIWPITLLTLALIFRKSLANLLSNIRRAELPWGSGALEFSQEAAQLNADANLPDPDRQGRETPALPAELAINYNTIQLERGLRPTASGLDLNYFRNLVLGDPNLALAALRMEIETVITNIAEGSEFPIRDGDGAGRNLRALLERNLITNQQFETTRRILDLCNRAIHGVRVDATTALAVIEAAEPLLEDYKAWLYWNWPDREG
jgi:hypothetical protein